jgi:hypothetical protein
MNIHFWSWLALIVLPLIVSAAVYLPGAVAVDRASNGVANSIHAYIGFVLDVNGSQSRLGHGLRGCAPN